MVSLSPPVGGGSAEMMRWLEGLRGSDVGNDTKKRGVKCRGKFVEDESVP